MGGLISHIFEFLWTVIAAWRNLAAVAVFSLFSFPNAVLSADQHRRFLACWPVESRRKWLLRAAIAYVLVSCFLAWDDERSKLEQALGAPSEIHELREQIAKLSAHRWEPLSAEEAVALRTKLRMISHTDYIALICQIDGCADLADSLSSVFEDVQWEHHSESAMGGIKTGVVIWTSDDSGLTLADAIEISTNGRIKVSATKHPKIGLAATQMIDRETQLIIGRKP